MRLRLVASLMLNIFFFVFLTGFIGLPIHPGTVEADPNELYKSKRSVNTTTLS